MYLRFNEMFFSTKVEIFQARNFSNGYCMCGMRYEVAK